MTEAMPGKSITSRGEKGLPLPALPLAHAHPPALRCTKAAWPSRFLRRHMTVTERPIRARLPKLSAVINGRNCRLPHNPVTLLPLARTTSPHLCSAKRDSGP